ncbi:hypothetical protein ACVJA9_006553 [Bradyrhizobium diazoefficiens]
MICAPAAPSRVAAAASAKFRAHHPQRRLARGAHELARRGHAQALVEDNAHRRTRSHAGQAAGEKRIIRQHRADADQDGIALRAEQMDAIAHSFARDRDRLAAGGADLAVGRDCELQDHMWAPVADAAEMPGVVERSLRRAETHVHRDAGRTQTGMALACDFRIGILDRRHHALDAGRNHRIGTRRRFAEMRARLQRDVERGPARRLTGTPQGLGLAMRTSAGLRPAAADDDAVFHDDGADGRIGPGPPLPAPAERQRKLHEAAIGVLGFADLLRELILQDAEDHLRIAASRASSSPESSPSTSAKSLASRKLR